MAELIVGQRDPKMLTQLAKGRMRAQISTMEEASSGHFTDHHAFSAGMELGIEELDGRTLIRG